jgi:hypothetical protein
MGSTGLFKFNPESYVKKMDGYIIIRIEPESCCMMA